MISLIKFKAHNETFIEFLVIFILNGQNIAMKSICSWKQHMCYQIYTIQKYSKPCIFNNAQLNNTTIAILPQNDIRFGPSPQSSYSSFSGYMVIMPQKQLSESVELHVPTEETECAMYTIAEDDVKLVWRIQGFSKAKHHSFYHKIRPGPW